MRFMLTRALHAAALVLALGIDAAAQAAPDVPDVLERPALPSARAASAALLAVARAGKRLVSVGERGIIVLSDDDGNTWRQAKVPVSVSLTNVRFVNEQKGWAVGHSGVVLHSADGGQTWQRQLGGEQVAALVLDAARAKVARQPSDANRKELAEAERLVADGPDKPFFDVHFHDENNGVVVGAYGLAFATQNGGKRWLPWSDRIPNPQGRHLYSIHTSGNTWFITGEQGALFRSADGGSSFVSVKTPYSGTYFGALGGANGELVVFGLRGNVYWSGDGGDSWQKVDGGSATLTGGVRMADGTLVLVDHAGQALQSRDGGKTFRRLPLQNPAPASGIAQAADGALIVSGMRGVRRVVFDTTLAERKP
jgi:photosystem II stability/assembly factor-like uncharacterized protein